MTRRIIPLSGKKNYFWYGDHWNSLYQPKAIHQQSFGEVQRNGMPRLEWMMWTTLLKTTQWMIFAYHRKWMGPMTSPLLKMMLDSNCWEGQPMGNWHDGGASWEQHANAGNDSGNWGGTPSVESESTVWKGYSITEETESTMQLMPTIKPSTCVCSQELEHFQFIKVLPISVSRIQATQHTTVMNGDGRCRCKRR